MEEANAYLPEFMEMYNAKFANWLSLEVFQKELFIYTCYGGDRKFFKENNVNPAEFLKIVWMFGNNENAIIDWVATKRKELEGNGLAKTASFLDKVKAFFKK